MNAAESANNTHGLQRRNRHVRTLLVVLCAALGLLTLTLLDRHIWSAMLLDPEKTLERKDWWQLLRQFGSLLFWLVLGGMFMLHDSSAMGRTTSQRAEGWRRGLLLVLAAGLSGLFAEILKGLSQRARPGATGEYRFGWIEDNVGGLGLASSHAATAFGGAIMLGWLFPALRWPALVLAGACAMTRVVVGAHYATDVYVAILLSYGVCRLVWRVGQRRAVGEMVK
jgi:membrane-associated phospholipid phosphatase